MCDVSLHVDETFHPSMHALSLHGSTNKWDANAMLLKKKWFSSQRRHRMTLLVALQEILLLATLAVCTEERSQTCVHREGLYLDTYFPSRINPHTNSLPGQALCMYELKVSYDFAKFPHLEYQFQTFCQLRCFARVVLRPAFGDGKLPRTTRFTLELLPLDTDGLRVFPPCFPQRMEFPLPRSQRCGRPSSGTYWVHHLHFVP